MEEGNHASIRQQRRLCARAKPRVLLHSKNLLSNMNQQNVEPGKNKEEKKLRFWRRFLVDDEVFKII